MSKTIGKVLAVAAVVVGVVAAIPTGGASLGLSAAALSALSVGIAAASLLNSALLKSGAKTQLQARQASVVALQLGEVPREALFGEALTGGSLVDAFNFGGQYGTDWECRVVALADHRCDGLTGFYVNDVYVPFAGDGTVAGYNGQLEVYFRPGTTDQAVPAVMLANGPGWTPSDIGYGVCWVAVCYKADKADAKAPVWPAGRPAFAWLVRGKRCYQARKDGSVGGAGSHRWADPSTWEWTDNVIDCRYNWVRGVYAGDQVGDPGMLLVGRGLSTVEAPPANVFSPANVCDEVVPLDAGGSERRYRANGLIKADETYIDVEEHFAAACGGVILQPEGAVEIEPGQAKAPVFFFSDDDLLVGSSVDFTTDLPDSSDAWVNTVVPRYIEPTLKYADHAAPVRRLIADVVADGGPREQSLSLALVTSSTQAGRVGEIARRMGRLLARARVTLGPVFAEVEEGDWGVWTSQRYLKGGSMLVRVESYALDERWQNSLTLRGIATGVYAKDADAASTSVALQQPVPSGPAPQPGAWALSAPLTTRDDPLPILAITGAADTDYAELIRFEFAPAAGVSDPAAIAAWTEASLAGPDARRAEIASVGPTTAYYAAVSYVVGRVPGPRLVLGPVTTAAIDVVGEQGPPGRDGRDGKDGLNGTNGAPGAPGADGRTSYVHYAYANSPDGRVDFDLNQPAGRAYEGSYTDFTAADSPDPAAYVWREYKGPPAFGLTARGYAETAGNSLVNVQYPSDPGYGDWGYAGGHSTEGWRGGAQTSFRLDAGSAAGLNTDPTTTDNYPDIDYAWLAQTDGKTYIRAAGEQILYGITNGSRVFQIAYDNALVRFYVNGAVIYEAPATPELTFYFDAAMVNGPGNRVYDVAFSSAGRVGKDGADGLNGTNGIDGTNGQSIHIAYANSANGTVDFTTGEAGGRAYIGVYTDTDPGADSPNPARYGWTLIRGADGARGLAGPGGYAHIAYANSADGTVDFHLSDPTNRRYIGTYTDQVEADSGNPGVYAWQLVKGADGAAGIDGLVVTTSPAAFVIPCYSNGAAKPGWTGGSCVIRFQKGGASITPDGGYSVPAQTGMASLALTGATVTFAGIIADKAEFTVRATHGGVTYDQRVTAVKAKDGEAAFKGSVNLTGSGSFVNPVPLGSGVTVVPAGRNVIVSAMVNYDITEQAAGNFQGQLALYWRNATDGGAWNLLGSVDGSAATSVNRGTVGEPNYEYSPGTVSASFGFVAPPGDKQIGFEARMVRVGGGRNVNAVGSAKLEVSS